MALRRAVLLILGFAGSILAAVALYICSVGTLAAAPEATEPSHTAMTVSLPLAVPGTSLIAEQISSYDGPFLEDGSDREVVNVAALHVYNAGEYPILKALITLRCDDELYVFYGEHIPPGARTVLLEQQAGNYRQSEYIALNGWQVVDTSQQATDIMISDRSVGTVVVTNLSNQTRENVRLYYKVWLSPPDVYMGGIVYWAEIPILLPGQTLYLYPAHYAAGYTKVVSVTEENTPGR